MGVGTQTMTEMSSQNASKKPSWASVVQNKSCLSKHEFNVSVIDGAPTVEVPDDIIESSSPLWEDFLIGKFLEKAPRVAKVHVIVNKILTLGDQTVRIDAYEVDEYTIRFRIRESGIRARVLRRGMWNIAEIPMVVSKWSPIIEEEKTEAKTVPMWITMKNVPPKMFSRKGLGFIASAVGEPKLLHPDTETCKSFEEAKIFVEVDLTKEFPDSFRFKSKKGVDAVVLFKYPWLPLRCSTCSKWGHLTKNCSVQQRTLSLETVEFQAGKDSEVNGVPEMKETQSVIEPHMGVPHDEQHSIETTGVEKEELNSKEESVEQASVTETSTEKEDGSGYQTVDEESWSDVSPSKAGRAPITKAVEKVLVSPSKYSVLSVEEGEILETEHQENEESHQSKHKRCMGSTEDSENLEEQGTRPSLPRISKSSHKYLAESGAIPTRKPPSGLGKKVTKKKK